MDFQNDDPKTSNTYPLRIQPLRSTNKGYYPTDKIVTISEEEENGKLLGEGNQGSVRICILTYGDPREDQKVAVKQNKRHGGKCAAKKEIEILMKLGEHKHVVGFIGYHFDENDVLQVMELCSKGDLFNVVNNRLISTDPKHALNPHESLYILRQSFSVLEFLHSKRVIHGDLKLENILISRETSTQRGVEHEIKVCDFDKATQLMEGDFASEECGTIIYWAPEIAKCYNYDAEKKIWTKQKVLQYDTKVDIWCVGVMLFIMLIGDYPFKEVDTEKTEPRAIPSFPNNLNRFLHGLLMVDPIERLAVVQCLTMSESGTMEKQEERRKMRGAMVKRVQPRS